MAARNEAGAAAKVAQFRKPPRVVAPSELAEADIVLEAASARALEAIVLPAIERARTVIVSSVGGLLGAENLMSRARERGARVLVPSGALAGLGALRALAPSGISAVTLETRKLPRALAGAPYLERNGIDVSAIREPTCVFRGNALEAAQGFPANANVAAALALAGIGAMRTRVEIWADPAAVHNTHIVHAKSQAADLSLSVRAIPSPENPRTSQLASLSVLACLRGLTESIRVGT